MSNNNSNILQLSNEKLINLFDELSDPDISNKDLEKVIARAGAATKIAKAITDNAHVVLKAESLKYGHGVRFEGSSAGFVGVEQQKIK